jgi:hypothetical protein
MQSTRASAPSALRGQTATPAPRPSTPASPRPIQIVLAVRRTWEQSTQPVRRAQPPRTQRQLRAHERIVHGDRRAVALASGQTDDPRPILAQNCVQAHGDVHPCIAGRDCCDSASSIQEQAVPAQCERCEEADRTYRKPRFQHVGAPMPKIHLIMLIWRLGRYF